MEAAWRPARGTDILVSATRPPKRHQRPPRPVRAQHGRKAHHRRLLRRRRLPGQHLGGADPAGRLQDPAAVRPGQGQHQRSHHPGQDPAAECGRDQPVRGRDHGHGHRAITLPGAGEGAGRDVHLPGAGPGARLPAERQDRRVPGGHLHPVVHRQRRPDRPHRPVRDRLTGNDQPSAHRRPGTGYPPSPASWRAKLTVSSVLRTGFRKAGERITGHFLVRQSQ